MFIVFFLLDVFGLLMLALRLILLCDITRCQISLKAIASTIYLGSLALVAISLSQDSL
jgi:hypothetical protein